MPLFGDILDQIEDPMGVRGINKRIDPRGVGAVSGGGSKGGTAFGGLDVDKLVEMLGEAGAGPTSIERGAMEARLTRGTIPSAGGLPYKSSALANIAKGTADITRGVMNMAEKVMSMYGGGMMGGFGG